MERYLSPKELAEAVGVSESSLKRWADEGLIRVTRTGGGHRRIALTDALNYIRATGIAMVRPEVLGLTPLPRAASGNAEADSDAFIAHAVTAGNLPALRAALLARYLAGASLGALCDGPLAEALREVGEAWKSGPAGIHLEHRTCDACIHGLNYLRGLLPSPSTDAPLALGCTPEGDPYQIPTLMAATVIAAEGWREINLGPNLPLAALMDAAREHRPTLIWVSFTSASAAKAALGGIGALEKTAREIGASLVLGGAALAGHGLPDKRGAHVLTSMQALGAFARGIVTSHKAAKSDATA